MADVDDPNRVISYASAASSRRRMSVPVLLLTILFGIVHFVLTMVASYLVYSRDIDLPSSAIHSAYEAVLTALCFPLIDWTAPPAGLVRVAVLNSFLWGTVETVGLIAVRAVISGLNRASPG